MMSVYSRWSFGVLLWELATMGKTETALATICWCISVWKWMKLIYVQSSKSNTILAWVSGLPEGRWEGRRREGNYNLIHQRNSYNLFLHYRLHELSNYDYRYLMFDCAISKGNYYVVQEDPCSFVHIPRWLSNPFWRILYMLRCERET